MRLLNFLVPVILLLSCVEAMAQTPTYKLGRRPTEKEILERDIFVMPDGEHLPPGRGTAQEGANIYARKCAACHGPTGTEGWLAMHLEYEPPSKFNSPRLVSRNLKDPSEPTVGMWLSAPPIWDYINREMPLDRQNSLTPNEVYAVTAWLLYRNGIIKETDVMDEKTLPKVEMRDPFQTPKP